MCQVQELAHLNSFLLLWLTAFKREIQGFYFFTERRLQHGTEHLPKLLQIHDARKRLIIIWEASLRCHVLQFLIFWLISAFYGITSVFISINSYVFLMLLVTSSLRRGKKKTCLPDTFQKEDINRVFFVFLISSINLLGEIQGLCQNFKCILGGDK